MNLRAIGNKLEEYIVGCFKAISRNAIRSSTSGGKGQKTDVITDDYIIECKVRNTGDFTIKRKTWYKTCAGVVSNRKTPLYIIENKFQDRLVVMDVNDFFRIIERGY